MSDEVRTLVASTTGGRYALDDAQYGRDLSSGQPVEILISGQWISGRIEYATDIYANEGLQFLGDKPKKPVIGGYYFIGSDGGVCGLCLGMKVRIPD